MGEKSRQSLVGEKSRGSVVGSLQGGRTPTPPRPRSQQHSRGGFEEGGLGVEPSLGPRLSYALAPSDPPAAEGTSAPPDEKLIMLAAHLKVGGRSKGRGCGCAAPRTGGRHAHAHTPCPACHMWGTPCPAGHMWGATLALLLPAPSPQIKSSINATQVGGVLAFVCVHACGLQRGPVLYLWRRPFTPRDHHPRPPPPPVAGVLKGG